jgi:hypothetical protein
MNQEEKSFGLQTLLKNFSDVQNQLKMAFDFQLYTQADQLRSILRAWKLQVKHRHIDLIKTARIHEIRDYLTAQSIFSHWKDSTLNQPHSLFSRQALLQHALRKMNILRALDSMKDYKERAWQLKETFALCLSALNDWIEKRNLEFAFETINKRIDFEDRRDFFAQRVVSFCDGKMVKIGFGALKGFALAEKWGGDLCDRFLVGVRKRRMVGALGVWSRLAV